MFGINKTIKRILCGCYTLVAPERREKSFVHKNQFKKCPKYGDSRDSLCFVRAVFPEYRAYPKDAEEGVDHRRNIVFKTLGVCYVFHGMDLQGMIWLQGNSTLKFSMPLLFFY